jgi:DNA-binding transcriptional regulator PaaX
MAGSKWLLLTYKVPSEPVKNRVALWRKLKSLGAVYLQSGVCLLPKTEEHRRQLRIVEHEISEHNGDALLLETFAFDRVQEDRVIERFRADREAEYRELLSRCDDYETEIKRETTKRHFSYAELEENDEDLKKLKRWFDKIQTSATFRTPNWKRTTRT